jgi:hypothetical protein
MARARALARRPLPLPRPRRVEYTEEDPKPQLEEACKVDCLKEWHNYKVRPPGNGRGREGRLGA